MACAARAAATALGTGLDDVGQREACLGAQQRPLCSGEGVARGLEVERGPRRSRPAAAASDPVRQVREPVHDRRVAARRERPQLGRRAVRRRGLAAGQPGLGGQPEQVGPRSTSPPSTGGRPPQHGEGELRFAAGQVQLGERARRLDVVLDRGEQLGRLVDPAALELQFGQPRGRLRCVARRWHRSPDRARSRTAASACGHSPAAHRTPPSATWQCAPSMRGRPPGYKDEITDDPQPFGRPLDVAGSVARRQQRAAGRADGPRILTSPLLRQASASSR